MENKMKWLFNLPKKNSEEYLKESGHENLMIGKPKDAGCYYGVQLEGMGIVGIYSEDEVQGEKNEV